jgi:hypothetical protein
MIRQTFPSRVPIALVLGGMFGLLSLVPCVAVWQRQQDPVRAFYLKSYVRLSTSRLKGPGKGEPVQTFRMLVAQASRGVSCVAKTPLLLPSRAELLTREETQRAGQCQLTTTPSQMKMWLRGAVYDGLTCTQLLRLPLMVWAGVLLSSLVFGGLLDVRRKERGRVGIQIRGPQLVSRWTFNRIVQGDGFPIVLENRRNLLELMRGQSGKVLRIRLRDENKNIITMSDPGGGKTSILMQILDEVERRG